MASFPVLVAPYQRVPLVHDTTDLFDPETQAALDSRYAATGVTPPDASTTVKGIVELATSAETTTGTDTVRAVTPAGLAAVTATRAPIAARTTAAHTTSSLANNAYEQSTITITKTFALLTVQVDRAARVRLYYDSTAQSADAARATGTYPTTTGPNHGCFLEAIFTAAGTYQITSGAIGFVSSGSTVYLTTTNTSGSTSTVVVTIGYLGLEA